MKNRFNFQKCTLVICIIIFILICVLLFKSNNEHFTEYTQILDALLAPLNLPEGVKVQYKNIVKRWHTIVGNYIDMLTSFNKMLARNQLENRNTLKVHYNRLFKQFRSFQRELAPLPERIREINRQFRVNLPIPIWKNNMPHSYQPSVFKYQTPPNVSIDLFITNGVFNNLDTILNSAGVPGPTPARPGAMPAMPGPTPAMPGQLYRNQPHLQSGRHNGPCRPGWSLRPAPGTGQLTCQPNNSNNSRNNLTTNLTY